MNKNATKPSTKPNNCRFFNKLNPPFTHIEPTHRLFVSRSHRFVSLELFVAVKPCDAMAPRRSLPVQSALQLLGWKGGTTKSCQYERENYCLYVLKKDIKKKPHATIFINKLFIPIKKLYKHSININTIGKKDAEELQITLANFAPQEDGTPHTVFVLMK